MMKQEILKDVDFEEIAEAKVDAKHRVTLGRILNSPVSSYRIYRNSIGQIILDPLVTVPAYEAWLFKNEKAAKLLKQGLADARRGRLMKAKENYTKYLRDET